MAFDPMNPPKNLEPSQAPEAWRSEDDRPAAPSEETQEPADQLEEREANWSEDDSQEAPQEAEQEAAAQEPEEQTEEETSETAPVEEPEQPEQMDLSSPEKIKEYLTSAQRKEKKQAREISRQSKKNYRLKEELKATNESLKALADAQRLQFEQQAARERHAQQQQAVLDTAQEFMNRGLDQTAALEMAQIYLRSSQQPAQRQVDPMAERLERLERMQSEQVAQREVNNYTTALRSHLKTALKGKDVSEDELEGIYQQAVSLAATNQIRDPKEAAAHALKPVIRHLKAAKPVQRRPVGKDAEAHRMVALSGRSGSRQAGSHVSGKQTKKSAEELEAEWGSNEPW